MPLTTSVLYVDGIALLALDGELDLAVLGQVDAAVDAILADGKRLLLIDLDALRFCDSSGLGALLRASRLVTQAGGTCLVAGARGAVQRLFVLTSIEHALQLVPEVPSALARLRGSASGRSSGC